MRPEPGKIPVPSPSPTSPLLQFDTDSTTHDENTNNNGHFFNPKVRMNGLKSSTISMRFESSNLNNESLAKKKKSMKSKKMRSRASARRSTRVRVSSFFSTIFNPRRSRNPNSVFEDTTITRSLGVSPRPKRSLLKRIFGFMRKSQKQQYDIVDYEPETSEQLAEGLDIDFDTPTDPRQHFRNTPNIFGSQTSVEGRDIMKDNVEEKIPKDNIESVDLFQVDKMRQSHSNFSWTSPEEERDPAISFAGKTTKLLEFPTRNNEKSQSLHDIELNKSKKRKGSLFLLEMESPRQPIPTVKTLQGEDLPKLPIKVKSSRQFPLDDTNSEDKESFGMKENPEPDRERSVVWSVDDNVTSVLASAATLKRKKKSSVLRESTKRETSAATYQDNTASSALAPSSYIEQKKVTGLPLNDL